MSEQDDDRRRKLAVIATALGEEVVSLRAAEEQQSKEFSALREEIKKKNWRTTIKIRWMIALVILDLVLSGAMLVGYLKITDVIDDQEVVRSQVLCPMFNVFIGSYDPGSRTAGPDRDKYEDNFRQMRDQRDALRCTGPLVPPRNDLPTHPTG